MVIYSSATAAESPQQTVLQPERKLNRVKTLLRCSSRSVLADVNGPYHPDAHPVGQLLALQRTRLLMCTRSTAARKSPHDRFRGGACTDQDVLPTLPGCINRVLLRMVGWLVFIFLFGGLIASGAPETAFGFIFIWTPFAFVYISLQQWDSYLKAHRKSTHQHHPEQNGSSS